MKRKYTAPHMEAIPATPSLMTGSGNEETSQLGNKTSTQDDNMETTTDDDEMGAKKHGGPFSEYLWDEEIW